MTDSVPKDPRRGKYGDRYDRFRDSVAVKRQRDYYAELYPDLYEKWLAFPGRKERRRLAALARKGVRV